MATWRKVDDSAILCDECRCNEEHALYADDEVIGLERICTAENDICVRLNKPIQNDKRAYDDYRDIFREGKEAQQE